MNKINMIKELGFNYDSIQEKDLKKEFVSLVSLILRDFDMDDVIKTKDLYATLSNGEQVLDCSKKYKFCRGFNKNNLSYDFICIKDDSHYSYELVINPTMQVGFDDSNFGDSVSIKYSLQNNLLEVKRLTTDENEDLVEENYLYTRSSRNKSLVLFAEVKTYNGFFVSLLEERVKSKPKSLYSKGIYKLSKFVKPQDTKVFITAKMENDFHILKVNDIDVGMVICNGTMVYDYDNDREQICDFKVISKNNDDRQSLIVNHINNYQDYITRQNLQNKIRRFY